MPEGTPETGGAGQVPANPTGTTPQTVPVTTTEPEPFDEERARRTIETQRASERDLKKQLGAQSATLAEMQKELEAFRAEKLTETEKLQKAAKDNEERALRLEEQYRRRSAELVIERVSRDMNFADGETAAALIRDRIEYDANGEPTNIADLLKETAEKKPFLLMKPPLPGAGAGATNPSRGGGAQTQTFTRAGIGSMSQQEYEANREAIIQAAREGRIAD